MADAAVEKPAEAPAPKEDLVIDPTPVAAAAAPASGTAASGKSASDSAAAKKRKKDDASKEEEDEDEEDEEEDEGEDEEDDDEEDEEDEEEESAPGKKSSGKKKKAKTKLSVNDPRYFLDTEAVVDDEDDEDDGDEDEVGVGRADELSEEEDNQVDLREQRKNYLTSLLRQDQDVDENMLQERYRNMIYDDDMPDADVEERTDIKQQSFLPTVRDPKLWMVRCKPGLEQSTAIALLQKFVDREISGDPNPLLIRSATAPAHLKGHIYVEAEKEAHAKAAIAGIRSLFQWSVRLVPINEMVDVLKVPTKEFKITKGAWVRVKRGLYTGDIAAVVDADEARGRVTIKLVPRLDFPHIKKVLEQSKDPTVTVPDKKKGRGKAPPQKFFNIDEVRAMGLKELVERRRDPNNGEMYEYFQGGRYRDGYLHKTVNLKSLDMINVVPTIDELARFQNRGEKDEDEDDLEMLARTRPKRKVQFSKGDNVKVIEGDLKHLMGVVESVEEDTVTIMPKHQDLKDLLSFPTAQLQKHFREGDHVRVIAGRHEGEVGLVLRVDEKVVVLFSDSTQKELKVLAADLQAASEVSTGRLELGNYELHDLVQIDAQGVGVIVRVERESFKVLDSNGTVRSIRLQEMGAKKNTRGVPSQAFDANSAPITINDQVQVLDGKNKGKQGVIKHLFRYFVFIFSREILDNSGIFVERAANVALVGGKGSRLAPAALSDPSRAPLQSPGSLRAQAGPHARLQGGMGGMGGRGGGRGGHGGGGGGGRGRGLPDPWVGKTARVVGGPWKGYVGIIKGTTDAACRIELHTNCKTVIVDKDKVKTIDATQQSVNAGGHGSMRGGVNYAEGSRTPMYDVMRTPMRDSEHTPMNPTTPMREAWDPHQPQTPAHTPGAWDRDESGSGHTPGWDGYGPSHTPGTGYSASGYREHNTPGTGGSHQPHTPNFAETPGSGYGEQRTPHDAPHTSASGAYSTPHMAFTPGVPPTPAGGAHGEYYGAGGADDKEDWFERDIEVKITTEAAGREHVNKKATLVEARTDSCLVKLANGESISVPKSALEAVIPTRKDRVKVTRGTDRGATGVIMGIDGNDAIVKMDADSDVKILTMGSIARYVGTS